MVTALSGSSVFHRSLRVAAITVLGIWYAGAAAWGCIGPEPTVGSDEGAGDSSSGGNEASSGSSDSSSSGSGSQSGSSSGSSGGSSREASLDCKVDASGSVGVLGCPCNTSGDTACVGNDSRQSLICTPGSSGLTWEGNGSCATTERCDTRSGTSTTGTCSAVLSFCSDASPGQLVCNTTGGQSVAQCGVDLITYSTQLACSYACVDAGCTGVCRPGTMNGCQMCTAAGQWMNICGTEAGTSAVDAASE